MAAAAVRRAVYVSSTPPVAARSVANREMGVAAGQALHVGAGLGRGARGPRTVGGSNPGAPRARSESSGVLHAVELGGAEDACPVSAPAAFSVLALGADPGMLRSARLTALAADASRADLSVDPATPGLSVGGRLNVYLCLGHESAAEPCPLDGAASTTELPPPPAPDPATLVEARRGRCESAKEVVHALAEIVSLRPVGAGLGGLLSLGVQLSALFAEDRRRVSRFVQGCGAEATAPRPRDGDASGH